MKVHNIFILVISLANHSHTYSTFCFRENVTNIKITVDRICLTIMQNKLQHAAIPLKTVKPADSPTKMTLIPSRVLDVWMDFILNTMEIAQASST